MNENVSGLNLGTVAGLLSKPKYSHNVIRTGDLMTNAPYTVLSSTVSATIIQLPFPQNILSSLTAEWQQEQVSIAGYALRHGGIDKVTSMKDAIMANPGIVGNMLTGQIDEFKDDANALLARAETKSTSSKITGPKIILNPRNEMLFKGMGFRSFSFVFVLVPMKRKDSDDIQKAIRAIQKASVPELRGAKMFMEYPETWNIAFRDSNEYLVKINECCCTRVDVNYSPNGSAYQVHEENAPLSVELTLDFTEVVIPTKENIDEFNG